MQLFENQVSDLQDVFPEAEFLDEIQTKVFRVFLVAIHSHLSSFVLSSLFLQTHLTTHNFHGSVQSENSQDYAQKPQRNCTFMNSASVCNCIQIN
jgi:hypothetical protein